MFNDPQFWVFIAFIIFIGVIIKPARKIFAINLGDKIQEIKDSILKNRERIKIVSFERITAEIIKMLKSKKPSVAFYLLKELSLLEFVFPELDIMSGI